MFRLTAFCGSNFPPYLSQFPHLPNYLPIIKGSIGGQATKGLTNLATQPLKPTSSLVPFFGGGRRRCGGSFLLVRRCLKGQHGEPCSWWFGLGFWEIEPLVLVAGQWKTSFEALHHQSKPPFRGKLTNQETTHKLRYRKAQTTIPYATLNVRSCKNAVSCVLGWASDKPSC